MIDYRFQGRLTYLPGGPLSMQMSAWPVGEEGWWTPTTGSATCVAAYQAIGAASLAASYVNLASPGTYDAAPGVAPDFNASTGWGFSALNRYLVTGVVPGDGWSMLVRFADGSGDGRAACGINQANMNFFLQPRRSGAGDDRVYGQGGTMTAGVRVADGVMAIANQVGYYNGSSDGAVSAWSGTNSLQIFIGCVNVGGSPTVYWNGTIQAVAIYSSALDATQVGEVTTAMAAL